jgi:hypothetical protein
VKVTQTIEIDLTPEQLGRMLADLDSDSQAKAFVAMAARGNE